MDNRSLINYLSGPKTMDVKIVVDGKEQDIQNIFFEDGKCLITIVEPETVNTQTFHSRRKHHL